MTRVRLCGPLAVEIDGRDATPAPGQAATLAAYLLSTPGREAARDELIAVLWPEQPPRDPQAGLRPILSRLRRVLPVEGRDRVRLALPEPVWVDVDAAAEAVARARATESAAHAEEAADLLRPGFLPGLDAEWANARRREVEELVLEALELVARLGDASAAERAARELIARSPYRESGHRLLMEALAAAGNAAEALRVYEDLRVMLRDELGAAPAAQVQAVHQRLLTGEPAPAAAPVALPAVLAPAERTAFVGRAGEQEVLRTAWAEARAGRRRLVLLGGDPGIGKTRLLSEFAREAHASGTVLQAACLAEPLLPYQPFVEALGQELEVDLSLDPEARRYRLFETVTAALDERARATPLLLVLDDLHWADGSTLQLLRHVIGAPAPVPLLVVGAYREAEVPRALAELIADLRPVRASLRGLPEREVRSLIATHAGHEAPPSVVRVVHRHTDGNPFFVEEVMRHLIGTGVLYERDGRWSSALTAEEIGVPEGVRAVVLARVDRLSEPCRTALAHGAVLGREFAFGVLAAVSDADEEALIAALEEALAAQLIVEVPGPAYAFTHALVREVVYAGLSAPRRQRLHARAAEAIDPSQLGAVAWHLRAAGSAGDPARAIDCSLRAGARAAEVSAWEDAAGHFEGAAVLLDDSPERAALLVGLADVLLQAGDLGGRIAALEQALAIYEGLGDDKRAAQMHSRLGNSRSLIDSVAAEHLDLPRAFAHFEAARTQLREGRSAGHLAAGVANAQMYALDVERGSEAARRGMEIGEQLGDELLWMGAAQAYGWHALAAGRLAEGFATLERSIEAADRHRQAFLVVMGYSTRGQLTWGLGAPDEAEAFLSRPLELDYVGQTSYRRELVDGLGRCRASRGELDAARELLPDARPAWVTHALEPQLALWEGRWDAVVAFADAALIAARRSGNRWDEFGAHHLAARALALRGEPGAAVPRLEQALPIVVDGGAVYWELWVRPDLARALAAAGRADEAREHAARCRELVAAGEDWRGRAGHVALAHAVVEADPTAFAAAHDTFARFELRLEQAEALREWGRVLGEPERTRAAETLLRSYVRVDDVR